MSDIDLSVVIATHDTSTVIAACLAALEPQLRKHAAEVIVVDSSSDDTVSVVTRQFSWVRLAHFDEPLGVPALRGRGIALARGQVIAIIDPFSVAASDWMERVLNAHEQKANLVIGGSVGLYRPEAQSWSAWAIYLNEYALFMPPVRQGETWIVPGANVSYKRASLFDGSTPRYRVFWKTFVNWEIQRLGSPLWLADDIRVDLNKPIPFSDYLKTRYDHGRCFAGMRVQDSPPTERAWRTISTAILPLLLVWRWTRGFWPKRRKRLNFLLTLPVQLALFAVWAIGEADGYVRGTGRRCDHLFY